ncbi:hypothetical protein HNV12_08530 [Methanococcoides sp. SA1]|nr:hypothetical protein [Methanococcoides sp. SA1]
MLSSGLLVFIGSITPIAAILCGVISKNKYLGLIVGITGPMLLYYSIYIYSEVPYRPDAAYYFGTLIILGGLTGYLTSIKKMEYNLSAVCLCLFYLIFFFKGFA